MEKRELGRSGIQVSALGFGAGQIGSERIPEREAERLLNQVIDQGINLIDTARAYGVSEERIGKYLCHRRDEIVLSTKVGYGVAGLPDWKYETITGGIERALGLLRTDVIDIVHLHSCPIETLEQGEVIQALQAARQAGKIRAAAYSGDDEALAYALQSGQFQVLEASVNFCDQRILNDILPHTQATGIGVIAKRPVANTPWRHAERPVGNYAEEYWLRWKTMQIDPQGLPWQELALRFSAFTPGVHSCIVGTTRLDHILENARIIAKGPLPGEMVQAIRQAFQSHDQNWRGQV